MSQGSDTIYRLPPYTLGPRVLMAHELKDKLDWGQALIGLPEIFKKTKGHGIRVGILDTGRPNHTDLAGSVVASKNFSSSFTDLDQQGHSTHVCGTLGARLNGMGVVGGAPDSEIVISKVLGDDGSGSTAGIVRGVDWCVEQGCHVLSMSLGGGDDPNMMRALLRAVRAGVYVICAAGNSGRPNSVDAPGKYPFTLAVASYNKQGQLSRFSSRGPEVDIAAPGEDILSTWLGNGFRTISGTSMATPFVSALVALLLAYQKDAEKKGHHLTPPIRGMESLKAHIEKASLDRGPIGRDPGWGWGVVDPVKFFDVVGTPAPVTTTSAPDPTDPDLPDRPEGSEEHYLFGGLIKVWEPVTIFGKKGMFVFTP